MNLFSLIEAASKRLKQNDPDFQQQTETTTAILRSSGVCLSNVQALMEQSIPYSPLQ